MTDQISRGAKEKKKKKQINVQHCLEPQGVVCNLQHPLTGNWHHLFMASSKSGFNPVRIIIKQPGRVPQQDNEDPGLNCLLHKKKE